MTAKKVCPNFSSDKKERLKASDCSWSASSVSSNPDMTTKTVNKLVARWPHGCRRKYSEVAVPMLVGSNPTEGGGFFQRKEPPPGHGCVCMSIRG
jgi:hypothetical protein